MVIDAFQFWHVFTRQFDRIIAMTIDDELRREIFAVFERVL